MLDKDSIPGMILLKLFLRLLLIRSLFSPFFIYIWFLRIDFTFILLSEYSA